MGSVARREALEKKNLSPAGIQTLHRSDLSLVQWRTQEFCSGAVQQIQLRTEDRQNGDLGAVAP